VPVAGTGKGTGTGTGTGTTPVPVPLYDLYYVYVGPTVFLHHGYARVRMTDMAASLPVEIPYGRSVIR
jgi:hypothetical protein